MYEVLYKSDYNNLINISKNKEKEWKIKNQTRKEGGRDTKREKEVGQKEGSEGKGQERQASKEILCIKVYFLC